MSVAHPFCLLALLQLLPQMLVVGPLVPARKLPQRCYDDRGNTRLRPDSTTVFILCYFGNGSCGWGVSASLAAGGWFTSLPAPSGPSTSPLDLSARVPRAAGQGDEALAPEPENAGTAAAEPQSAGTARPHFAKTLENHTASRMQSMARIRCVWREF